MAMIAIIGGGNMGMVLAAKFSQQHQVILFLNQEFEPMEEYWSALVSVNDQTQLRTIARSLSLTNDLEAAVKNADWIFVTYPAFLFQSLSKDLIPFLSPGQHLVGVPGSGGFELWFKSALDKGVTITGLQRVHSVARMEIRGKLVHESGVRSCLRCASLPSSFCNEAVSFLSSVYGLPVEDLGCYLNVTMVNSNPILHTARLYSIFKDYQEGTTYSSLPLFYQDWDLDSSLLLNQMDEELFRLLERLSRDGLVIDKVTPLLKHYESATLKQMTEKLRSIPSLKGLATPAKRISVDGRGAYVPDFSSRYFSADFPYGLDVLLAFGNLFGVNCPTMKMVSEWYHRVADDRTHFTLDSLGFTNESLVRFYS